MWKEEESSCSLADGNWRFYMPEPPLEDEDGKPVTASPNTGGRDGERTWSVTTKQLPRVENGVS